MVYTGKEWLDLHLREGNDEETLRGNTAVMTFSHFSKSVIKNALRENCLPVSGSRRAISIRLLNAISSREVDE